ncbi:MAG: hypothetical protein MUC49_06880 [Raineya sp.]|jgi:hypothetical protein|nr:hypothetical protein [Raineya sp.]
MKRLLLIVWIFWTPSFAQNWYVVKNIKGIVKAQDKLLKVGDTVDKKTVIQFSKSSAILLGNQEIKQVVFSPNEKTIQTKKKYILNDLLPQFKRTNLKTIVLNNTLDFQNHFGSTTFRVYGDNYVVKVASSFNVMYTNEQSDRFFFFQMSHPSEKELFRKHLQGVKNHLNFRENQIFTIKGKSINPKESKFLGLYFYDKTLEKPLQLADFQMEFVDDKQLLEAVKPLAEMLDKKILDINSYEIFCNQVSNIAEKIYGKADKEGLAYWIENKLYVYKPLK